MKCDKKDSETKSQNNNPEGILDGIRFLSEKEQIDLEEKRLIEFLSYSSHNFRNFILNNTNVMVRILENAKEVEKKRNNIDKVVSMTENYFG